MEIIERKENPLLNRVEIKFSHSHSGSPTPSRNDLITQLAAIEPGSNRDFVVIKDVATRFGVAKTTGVALIYSSKEAMSVEPKFIHKRRGGGEDADDAPAAPAAPTADVSGGEE